MNQDASGRAARRPDSSVVSGHFQFGSGNGGGVSRMIYLSRFRFPDGDQEFDFRLAEKRRCYDTYYPFHVLSARGLTEIFLDHITLLYGGNGSGKTTAINVMGETLGLKRDTLYNRSNFFESYTALCDYQVRVPIPEDSRINTSDDVFDFMLNLRAINQGIDRRREEIFQEYLDLKNANPGNRYSGYKLRSMEDYDFLRRLNAARSRTQSRFTRQELGGNVREQSNGESAYLYFTEKIGEGQLYLLDEPENSLSPQRQMDLAAFIEDSVRFFSCQFVIATHSPFLLALRGARVYDLDGDPVRVRPWTALPNVRAYYDFFRQHEKELEAPPREDDEA